MTSLREAAQAALEVMDSLHRTGDTQVFDMYGCEATEALRAALAEPVQEPVAWMVYTLDGKSVCVTDNPSDFTEQHKALPLYTAPPQRKPLTEEELDVLAIDEDGLPNSHIEFARAIERAHGIT